MSSTTGFALGVVVGIVALLLLSAAMRLGRATLADDDGPRTQAEAIGSRESAAGAAIERAPELAAPPPPQEVVTRAELPVEEPHPVDPSGTEMVEVGPEPARRRPTAPAPKPDRETAEEPEPAPLEEAAGVTAAETAASSAAELFSRATAASRRGETDTALAEFAALRERFPVSREARTSWVLGGRLLLGRGDAKAALGSFDRYLEGSGRGPLVPEAMAGRAKALVALGHDKDARTQWQAIVDRFPRSSAAAAAKRKLAEGSGR